METYHKLFIKASILYLLLGGTMGILLGAGLLDPVSFKFAHVHINLLGFVISIIYGVAYHILPRFNGVPLSYPNLVKVHFYVGNGGLLGMVLFYTLASSTDSTAVNLLFYLSAVAYLASIGMFAVNIMQVLAEKETEIVPEEIGEQTTPSRILKKWPEAVSAFESNGLGLVNSPGIGLFYRTWSIGRLCRHNGVDLELFLAILKMGIKRIEKKLMETGSPGNMEMVRSSQPVIKRGELCDKDVLVGDLLKIYPETGEVFEKHYGKGCFSCPGQAYENIEETAGMHNVSIDMILEEINEIIRKEIS